VSPAPSRARIRLALVRIRQRLRWIQEARQVRNLCDVHLWEALRELDALLEGEDGAGTPRPGESAGPATLGRRHG